MLNVNRRGFQSDSTFWAVGLVSLESEMSRWYREIEPTLVAGVKCNISLWSNEHCLVGAVASFSVEGNSDDELVIEVKFYRESPSEKTVGFIAEVCRESGPPLAVLPLRRIPQTDSGGIAEFDLEAAVADLRSFLIAHSPLITQQLTAIAQCR
jgi:hypothetical protein